MGKRYHLKLVRPSVTTGWMRFDLVFDDTSKNTRGIGGNELLLHVTDAECGWLWSLNGRQLVEVGGLNGECLVKLCSLTPGPDV